MPCANNTALVPLISVCIGAAIPLLISSLDKKHKKQILLREKYEEMSYCFSDFLRGHSETCCATSREELFQPPFQIPGRQLETLCALYFPELVEPASDLLQVQYDLYMLLLQTFDPNLSGNAIIQSIQKPSVKKVVDKFDKTKADFEALAFSDELKNKYIKA
jgi:hypothetical protein